MLDLPTILTQALTCGRKSYQTVVENQVNSQNASYVRKSTHLQTERTGHGASVSVASEQRCADPLALRQLGHEKTISEYFSTVSTSQQEFQSMIGQVGEETLNLAGRMQTFFDRIQNPAQAQGTPDYFEVVMRDAQEVTKEFNRLSAVLQESRTKADQALYTATHKINLLLEEYHSLNGEISAAEARNQHAFSAEDRREAIFLELSSYFPVVECPEVDATNGRTGLNYLTDLNGVALVTRAHANTLAFSRAGAMEASDTLEGGQLSGIQVTFDQIITDITKSLTAGRLGGWLTLRDQTLPKIQGALDQMAVSFQDQLNDIHNLGTAFKSPTVLEGNQGAQNSIIASNPEQTKSGILRVAVTSHTDGSIIAFKDINLATTRSIQQLVTEINNIPGNRILATLNNDRLRLQANGPNCGIGLLAMSPDATKLLQKLGLNNLFVSDPDRKPHDAVTPGIAAQIAVNPRLLQDPAQLSHGFLSDSPTLKIGDTGMQASDWRNLLTLGLSQEDSWYFPPAGDLAAQNLRPFDYCRMILYTTSQKAAAAQSALSVANLNTTAWEKRLQEAQGVNLEENELAKLSWNTFLQGVMDLVGNTYRLDMYFLELFKSL